jgi:hypothetical protein
MIYTDDVIAWRMCETRLLHEGSRAAFSNATVEVDVEMLL